MTDRGELSTLVARANPVDDSHDVAQSLDLHEALLAVIDDRSTDMANQEYTSTIRQRPATVRPIVSFVAALAVVLVAVGASTMLLTRSTSGVDPADHVPTTVAPESSTATTLADAALVDEPAAAITEPRVTWARIDYRVDAPGGGVAIGEGRVAVSGSQTSLGDSVWYSDDLEVWTMATVEGVGAHQIGAMAYGPDGWVAAGSRSSHDFAFWHSQDATRWVLGTVEGVPEGSSGWVVRAIAAGGPGWVAAGSQQRDGRIWVSTDGLAWETIALPEFDEVNFDHVDVEDGVVTVVGHPIGGEPDTSAKLDDVVALRWTSSDGRTWTPLPFQEGPVGPETHTISTNPETGEQIALNSYGVWVSDDGVEWTQAVSSNGIPPYTHPSQEVVWIGDTMIGGSRDFMYESSDGGETWVRTGPTDDWPFEYGHVRRLFSFGDKVILLSLTDVWVGTVG